MRSSISAEGISICPEAATCVLAARKLVAQGRIARDERVVLFNTGAVTKYVETMPLNLPAIDDPHAVDYAVLG